MSNAMTRFRSLTLIVRIGVIASAVFLVGTGCASSDTPTQQTGYTRTSTPVPTQTPTPAPAATSTEAPTATPRPATPAPTEEPTREPTDTPASGVDGTCTPLTNKGKCYEPGEFCRASDHGAHGVAGDGKAIVCANNNGWRWEPA